MGECRAVDAERQAAAAACTKLLATIDHPANRRAFVASLSGESTCRYPECECDRDWPCAETGVE